MSLTTDMIHELFYYKDGKLFNKVTRSSKALKDREAGCVNKHGYCQVNINKRTYLVHRIVYMLEKGHIPNNLHLDHVDGNRTNNHIDNLRPATHKSNSENRRKAKGYHYCRTQEKFNAQIKTDGKSINLGYYDTEEEARGAYLAAKKQLHTSTPQDYFK